MYSRCGSIADVCQVFDKMHTRDVVSYNVAAYADHRRGRKVLDIFLQLQGHGIQPDKDMLSKGILKMHLRSTSSKLG
jgi:pentatricopeptide repeat protein